MKARIFETNKRHSKYLAAAAVIALAVAFMLSGGGANAQNPLELNFESINFSVDEPAEDGARTNAEVGVLLSAESQTAVTVDFHTEARTATAGQDYIDVAITLHFPPGVTRRTVNVPILGDDLGEYTQRFRMRLSNPTGAQLGSRKEGQVTINDNPNDTFRAWAEPHINYVLESDGAAAVRVRLAGQYEHEFTMILQTLSTSSATVGQDYEYYSRTFTFAPYETEKTLHINILNDRKKEAPESIYTELLRNDAPVHLSGDDAFTNIWIGDDDHQKAIQSTTSDTEIDLRKRHFQVAEGDTDSYHVWLTRRPTEPVTIQLNPYDDHPDLTITSDRSHTFDADNWFEPYVVTIQAGQDDDSTDGYWYIRQEVETEDPFFKNHYAQLRLGQRDGRRPRRRAQGHRVRDPQRGHQRHHRHRGVRTLAARRETLPGQVGVLRSRPRRLHEDAKRSAHRRQRAGASRLPDQGGRPPLDFRDRGLRLGEPGDHHAGG